MAASRRTAGPFAAINGQRLGLLELRLLAARARRAPCCSWPRTAHFHRSLGLLVWPQRSLIGCSYRPPCSGCCRQRLSLLGREITACDLLWKTVWTKVHKLSWKDATGLVCKHARSWEASGGAELAVSLPLPDAARVRSVASPGFTIHLCALECGILICQAGPLGWRASGQ